MNAQPLRTPTARSRRSAVAALVAAALGAALPAAGRAQSASAGTPPLPSTDDVWTPPHHWFDWTPGHHCNQQCKNHGDVHECKRRCHNKRSHHRHHHHH